MPAFASMKEESTVNVAVQQQHYRAYAPTPFTKEQRGDVEILFGGLHWRAERLIKANFENLGYRARPCRRPPRKTCCAGASWPTSVNAVRPAS
jgi:hypothetical protein